MIFRHLMNDNITIKRLQKANAYGEKTYSEPETIKGRLNWKRGKTIDSKGEEALTEAVLFAPVALKAGDVVIVDGREWAIISVACLQGVYGGSPDHWECRI